MKPDEFYTQVDAWFPPRTRAWLYNVAVAVGIVLIAVGVITRDVSDALTGLAGALLGRMARSNTPA